jgi:hypothetical protein
MQLFEDREEVAEMAKLDTSGRRHVRRRLRAYRPTRTNDDRLSRLPGEV